MTPRERAIEFLRLTWYGGDDSVSQEKIAFENNYLLGVVTEAILADRQSLQSEIKQKLWDELMVNAVAGGCYNLAVKIVQFVFTQQSQTTINLPNNWCRQIEKAEENAKKDTWQIRAESVMRDYLGISDQSARIATFHEWQAQDAKTIQELNESNNALSKKIAQLEKEKNELTQKLERVKEKIEELNPPIQHRYEMCGSERCPACAAGFSQ